MFGEKVRSEDEGMNFRGRKMKGLRFLTLFLIMLGMTLEMETLAKSPIDMFPDRESFRGLQGIQVDPVSFENMENVNLSSDVIKVQIETTLGRGGIIVLKEKDAAEKLGTESPSKNFGILTARIRRSETPMPLGGKINSFAITLKLFQQVHTLPAQHQTWAITWVQSRSVIVGTQRPKRILEAIDEMMQSLIKDLVSVK